MISQAHDGPVQNQYGEASRISPILMTDAYLFARDGHAAGNIGRQGPAQIGLNGFQRRNLLRRWKAIEPDEPSLRLFA